MKKIVVSLILLFLIVISVNASSKGFNIDTTNILNDNNKIVKKINSNIDITYNLQNDGNNEIEELSKKITYLLLGDNLNESAEDYYNRRKEYLDYRYNPSVPKDENSPIGLDENSQEYKDDLVSGISVPGMFTLLDEMNIIYSEITSIDYTETEEFIISNVKLNNVSVRVASKVNPMEYTTENTNLTIHYFYKQLDGKYKLYYVYGETNEELEEYNNIVENTELENANNEVKTYESQLKGIYSYENINKLNTNSIFDNNKNNIFTINAFKNASIESSAGAVLIKDGLLVTTASFIKEVIDNNLSISAFDYNDKLYNIEGIVTIIDSANIAVIKLENKVESTTVISDKKTNKEDSIELITSNTGVGLSIQSGIVIANTNNYIETSIPITDNNQGSPLYNENGELIGIATNKLSNSSISYFINNDSIKEILNTLKEKEFENIKSLSLEEIRNDTYKNNNEEIINTIPKRIWKKYSKIGDIENSIKLDLVKASYDKNVVSLRYLNKYNEFDPIIYLNSFESKLLNDGYTKEIKNNKNIYTNKKYKIIVFKEFNYLIVEVVKL